MLTPIKTQREDKDCVLPLCPSSSWLGAAPSGPSVTLDRIRVWMNRQDRQGLAEQKDCRLGSQERGSKPIRE